MKRNFDLKRRESKNLPPEKLKEILLKIYPEHTVDGLMDRLVNDKSEHQNKESEEK